MKNEIIEKLALNKTVEKLITKVTNVTVFKKDLANDIYLSLLVNERIKDYNEEQIIAYIVGIIKNQVNSKNSHYYKNYNRWAINKVEFKEFD